MAISKALSVPPEKSCLADMIGQGAFNALAGTVEPFGWFAWDGLNNYTGRSRALFARRGSQ